jgi:hypothetical protein
VVAAPVVDETTVDRSLRRRPGIAAAVGAAGAPNVQIKEAAEVAANEEGIADLRLRDGGCERGCVGGSPSSSTRRNRKPSDMVRTPDGRMRARQTAVNVPA